MVGVIINEDQCVSTGMPRQTLLGDTEPREPVEQHPVRAMDDPSCLITEEPQQMPLKVGTEEGAEGSHSSVKFSQTVSVLPIPGRTEYCDQLKQRLWSDKKELETMAARNLLEFASEGWDWRNAKEDEDMLHIGGEVIHPIHSNPLLASALLRQIPYPRPVAPPDEEFIGPTEESGAIYSLDAPVERPESAPPPPYDEFDVDFDLEDTHGIPFQIVRTTNRPYVRDSQDSYCVSIYDALY